MDSPLIILTGPTAVGKTELSVLLAKAVGGEIVSADSMQVYRHMDIGSDKIKPAEMKGVPHHLVDILEPEEEFHVALFKKMAEQAVTDIYARGNIPILVGGTGFYIQALLYDIDFMESQDTDTYRNELELLAKEKGADYIHQMLAAVDMKAAMDIHKNNVRRVIRALEFFRQTGMRISEHNARERQKQSPYKAAYFVLCDERSTLYKKIELRVDNMMASGLVEEVNALRERGLTRFSVSMQGLGYKEIFSFLEGEITLEEAIRQIKRDTRHFAKRQITWFKRERDVIWVNKQEFSGNSQQLLYKLLDELDKQGIKREK